MSMLSAQVDELRAMAESVGLAMPQAATLMMEAADTIWKLRDSVHRERAEADRLRERITTQKQTIQAYRDESREWREVADHAQAENAKLRELVRGLHMAYIGIIGQCESFDSSLTWEFSGDVDADLAKQHASYEQDRHRFDVAMRELGIEVEK